MVLKNIHNPVSWLSETVHIWKQEPMSQRAKEINQYFDDYDKKQQILNIIETKDFTTNELQKLIWEIQLKEMKQNLEKYLKLIKRFERKIIRYLSKKWMIDESKREQKIELRFTWANFEWLDDKMIQFIELFNHEKWSFLEELDKIEQDNYNTQYSLDIFLKKVAKHFIIQDMNISKKDEQ